jgi:predicted peroxiredoxin
MDVEVEMYFTARSVELLRRGVAEALQAAAGSGKSVADFRREAVGFGAKLFACPTALASHGVGEDELIRAWPATRARRPSSGEPSTRPGGR